MNLKSAISTILLSALCLAVLDRAEAQVLQATLSTANVGTLAVATNDVTNKAYVGIVPLSSSLPGLLVIDGATNTPTPISGTSRAGVIAVNSVTDKIYTAYDDGTGGFSDAVVQVVDGATNAVSNFTVDASIFSIFQMLIDPATDTLYVGAAANTPQGPEDRIFVVNAATHAVNSLIVLPAPFTSGTVNLVPDFGHGKFYTYLQGGSDSSSTLHIVDIAAKTVTAVAGSPSDSVPVGLDFDPQLNKVYLLNTINAITHTGTVSVFDGATGTLKTTRVVGANPGAMVLNPVTHLLFVWCGGYFRGSGHATLTVLDGNDLYPYTPPIGDLLSPASTMVVDSVANKIYIPPFADSASMMVINGDTFQVALIDGLPLAGLGSNQKAALNQTTHTLYGVDDSGGTHDVYVVDGTGGSSPFASVYPRKLSFSSARNVTSAPQTIYLTNLGSQPMTVTNLMYSSYYYYTIGQSNQCYNPIQPGQTCPIDLAFRPDAATPVSQDKTYSISVEAPALDTGVDVSATVTGP